MNPARPNLEHTAASSARRWRAFGAACAGLCLALSAAAEPVIYLLGEVHDNPEGHALRLEKIADIVRSASQPVIAMEQFDRERQHDIDHLLRHNAEHGVDPQATIEALAELGDRSGWDWNFYRPYLRLALQYRLPIIAANVAREQARAVMRQGLAAQGFDADVPADIASAHTAAIEASHCGMISAGLAATMTLAQVARDQFMARLVQAHAERGVVLLAGNGHVRKDLGVPRWLTHTVRAQTRVIGFLEPGDDRPEGFDQVIVTPAQARQDPCAAMRAAPRAASTPG